MVKKVLMIAYHYPPLQVSSGLQRTLAFSRYIRDYDWEPVVLSAHHRAYPSTDDGQLKDIPEGVEVKRAFALDTARHLAVKGKYSKFLALPDRWISWWFGGVFSGLCAIRKHRPKVIWSTYPIATAHLIGYTLHRLTGIPWVADFRDSMTEKDYPREGLRRKVFLWIERKVIKHCSKAVFTTPGAVRMYKERYPDTPESRWEMIPNGYNEEIFIEVENELGEQKSLAKEPAVLVHSGVVYPSERDPRPFFQALSELKKEGKISSEILRVVFRACGHQSIFNTMLREKNIEDIVRLEPSIPYREALREILMADGLLILQASSCNHQVPAKVYEYFRARKPIFSLTDIEGDTARTLMEAGLSSIAALDNSEEIKTQLMAFLKKLQLGEAELASRECVQRYSREFGVQQLASILQGCA